jgi:hypothetical protein
MRALSSKPFSRQPLLFLATLLLMLQPLLAAGGSSQPSPNNVGFDMYFNAAVNDAPECAMKAIDGHLRIDNAVTNPAFSCPDMLAWKVYIEVVQLNFIKSWTSGDLMWPSNPLPLCAAGSGKPCCTPSSKTNPGYDNPLNPGQYCPFYPDDEEKASLTAGKSNGSQRRDASRLPGVPEMHGSATVTTTPLTFYNQSMYDYIFRNNLYNSNGLVAVLNNANTDLDNNAPYRAVSKTGALTTVNFPINAWMIRSQWLSREAALAAGIKDDPKNPFIKVVLDKKVHYNFNPQQFPPGEYWLMGFHVSTKDTPPWFWADFEHVNSPGRCDFTGCNDSYGYEGPGPFPAGVSRNFTNPATINGPKGQAYIQGTTYATGPITPILTKIFEETNIGTSDKAGPWPAPQDKAWRAYRLRGSQWDFTDPAGRPTYAGSTASNGGIVTGTSCISCHATAGTLSTGPSPQILGVYFNWAGAPNAANFNLNARPATNIILQNDFVWGFMHTLPLSGAGANQKAGPDRKTP